MDIDCDDGIPCTTDVCVLPDGLCSNTLAADTCSIDGACYAGGTAKPDDPCAVCDPTYPSDWTPVLDGQCVLSTGLELANRGYSSWNALLASLITAARQPGSDECPSVGCSVQTGQSMCGWFDAPTQCTGISSSDYWCDDFSGTISCTESCAAAGPCTVDDACGDPELTVGGQVDFGYTYSHSEYDTGSEDQSETGGTTSLASTDYTRTSPSNDLLSALELVGTANRSYSTEAYFSTMMGSSETTYIRDVDFDLGVFFTGSEPDLRAKLGQGSNQLALALSWYRRFGPFEDWVETRDSCGTVAWEQSGHSWTVTWCFAWSDRNWPSASDCGLEPVDATLSVAVETPAGAPVINVTATFDGATVCDGCGAVEVDGAPAGQTCDTASP